MTTPGNALGGWWLFARFLRLNIIAFGTPGGNSNAIAAIPIPAIIIMFRLAKQKAVGACGVNMQKRLHSIETNAQNPEHFKIRTNCPLAGGLRHQPYPGLEGEKT